MNQPSSVLGIFCKQPIPGTVKTRLIEHVAPEWAAQVAEAFLLDTVDRVRTVQTNRVLVYTPASAFSYFADLATEDFAMVAQEGSDLGTRLRHFFGTQFTAGKEQVIVIGTDSPTLPLEYIEQAFEKLSDADVVLGPSHDGGYYLVGASRQTPPIFEGISWSTDRVLELTVTRLEENNLRLALLPPWYDIDTLADWRLLRGHVMAMRLVGIDPKIPHTEKILSEAACTE